MKVLRVNKNFRAGPRPLLLLLLSVVLFSFGCVAQGPSSNRSLKTDSSSGNADPGSDNNQPTPNFNSPVNFFQLGNTEYTNTMGVPGDFDDSFYLRGTQIHQYLNTLSPLSSSCLVFRFKNGIDKFLS